MHRTGKYFFTLRVWLLWLTVCLALSTLWSRGSSLGRGPATQVTALMWEALMCPVPPDLPSGLWGALEPNTRTGRIVTKDKAAWKQHGPRAFRTVFNAKTINGICCELQAESITKNRMLRRKNCQGTRVLPSFKQDSRGEKVNSRYRRWRTLPHSKSKKSKGKKIEAKRNKIEGQS